MADRRREEKDANKPLYNEAAERFVVGKALKDAQFFWESFQKLQPQHFTQPRLARVWTALTKAAHAGKPVNKQYVPMFITGDSDEATPLPIFLQVLINEIDETSGGDADAYVEMVVHLANKRSLLDALKQAETEILKIDVGTPVSVMVDAGIRTITRSVTNDFDDDMRTYGDWGNMVFAAARESLARGEEGGIGLACGLRAVEEVIGRLLPGKVYVLAGMSGGGKSALARQIMEGCAIDAMRQGLGWAHCSSLEMPGQEYASRGLSEIMGISAGRIESGDLNISEVEVMGEAVARLHKMPIVIDSMPRQTMGTIRSRWIKTKQLKGLALGIIDHALLVKSDSKFDKQFDRIPQTTEEAKNLAKELGIPVLLLAQLNEKNILERPSGWPNFSDLFGGQTIKQNSDVIFFVHRPEIVEKTREPAKSAKEDDSGESKHAKWVAKMDHLSGRAYVFADKRRGDESSRKREMRFHGLTMTFQDT